MSAAAIRAKEVKTKRRIDAEYYASEYSGARHIVAASHFPVKSLGELSESIINFGAYSLYNLIEFQKDGVPYLTAKEIGENFINWSTANHISEEQHFGLLWKSQVSKGQVLVAMAARLGVSCVFDDDFICNSSQDVAKVTLKEGLNPAYVSTFINSKYGRLQLLGSQTGSIQQHTSLGIIKSILVVALPERQQQQIATIVKDAKRKRETSESLYAQAQALLAAELGLDKLDLTEGLKSVRSVSEVREAGRADAEYFQPKYQRIMATMGRSGKSIEDVSTLATSRFKPQPDKPFQYIEIGNLSGDGHLESETVMGEDAPSRAQWIVKVGDVITSTVRPIRRLSALVEPEQDSFVCSSGFAVLQPKDAEPELLLLYLRLPIVCEILDLYTTASMYPAISTSDLLNIPITLPEGKALRKELVGKVRASRQARKDARRLLAEAKAEVERMIEGK